MASLTELQLLQARVPASVNVAVVEADVLAFCAAGQLPLRRLAWSPTLHEIYVYVASAAVSVAAFTTHCPWALDACASRLEQVFDISGVSHGAEPRFHYVVEMDPEDGWMPEITRWYDTEHMPGLAAVPGCIRASRFLNHGHGPLSLACYDLTHAEALGSAPWLAVRATAWSDVARPHFTNTKRTMFEVPRSVDFS